MKKSFLAFQTIQKLPCSSLWLRGGVKIFLATKVEFVHPVSAGGSVKFVASGVNFSIFTNFLCFFLLKLLKLGEIDGVKFLTWKSGGVKFWTNSMSVLCCLRTFLCCCIFLLLDLWSLTPTSDPNNVIPSSWNRFESCILRTVWPKSKCKKTEGSDFTSEHHCCYKNNEFWTPNCQPVL